MRLELSIKPNCGKLLAALSFDSESVGELTVTKTQWEILKHLLGPGASVSQHKVIILEDNID
jgi:hypothetical protein